MLYAEVMVVVPWNCRESLNSAGQEANLFLDSRYGFGVNCLYCGTELRDRSKNREHVPSKTLLDKDKPFPPNMPTVPSCRECNNAFSKDEQFISTLIECWRCDSTEPEYLERKAIARALERKPGLRAGVQAVLKSEGGVFGCDRFWNVVQKLVKAHVYFEMNRSPTKITPRANRIDQLSEQELNWLEEPPESELAGWPEIGSRAFIDAAMFMGYPIWWELQEGCYRYMVSDGDPVEVRIVISEFLVLYAQAWLDV